MSASTYTPKPDTLAARVVAYFKRLPDESLSVQDIGIKWCTDDKNVVVQLHRAVEAGLLQKDGKVFSVGPNLGNVDLSPHALLMFAAPPAGRGNARTTIDIESIEFEEAPAGLESPVKNHDRWVAKLRTMPAGKSFKAPGQYRHALRTAVTDLHKQGGWKLSVLKEGEDVRVVCTLAPVVGEGVA